VGELDTLVSRYPASEERLAAGYWAGRAWARLGSDSLARARWRAVVAREPHSYYAMMSARRLGEPVWAPADVGDSLPRDPAVDAAVARARLLARVGLDPEVQLEYGRLTEEASASTARLLATARAFQEEDAVGRAIALGRRALERGAPRTAAVYRLVYPVGYAQVLQVEASANALDRSLVAALIRQESNFTPAARSPVGARGLMQIMPAVGGRLARSLDFPVWDAVLLDQPDVSLQLGTRHLAGVLEAYDHPAYALAAYNAGASRVDRWRKKPGATDHELFIERIPYTETRDYVRIILRNRDLYAALYGW
jgi:soluble lytic murein transglycosylase